MRFDEHLSRRAIDLRDILFDPIEIFRQILNDQFFALFLPVFGAGAFAFAVAIAAIIGLFLRLRKTVVVDVACPACRVTVPFVVGESLHLFCPGCGGACRVDLQVHNKITTASAIPL